MNGSIYRPRWRTAATIAVTLLAVLTCGGVDAARNRAQRGAAACVSQPSVQVIYAGGGRIDFPLFGGRNGSITYRSVRLGVGGRASLSVATVRCLRSMPVPLGVHASVVAAFVIAAPYELFLTGSSMKTTIHGNARLGSHYEFQLFDGCRTFQLNEESAAQVVGHSIATAPRTGIGIDLRAHYLNILEVVESPDIDQFPVNTGPPPGSPPPQAFRADKQPTNLPKATENHRTRG